MNRTYVRVTLTVESEWRVGSWESEADDQLQTLRSGLDGGPLAPGSSLLGSLRAHAKATGIDVILFGPEAGTPILSVSPWWVLGTTVSNMAIESRGRVAIDQRRKAAARKGHFTAEHVIRDPNAELGASATVTMYLRSDFDDASKLLDLLKSWRPRLGGGRTVGMGRASIQSIVHRTLDLSDKGDALILLTQAGDGPARVDAMLKVGSVVEPDGVGDPDLLSVELTCDQMAYSEDDTPITHGSQWKGILRGRVAYIIRSLGGAACTATDENWTGCQDVDLLCPVCRVFGSTHTSGLLEFMSSDWSMARPRTRRSRIAIDRFTGGTRNGALWSQFHQPAVTMTLQIRAEAIPQGDRWVVLALFHAVRDLADGLVSVGPEGASGYGIVRVKDTRTVGLAPSSGANEWLVPPGSLQLAKLPPIHIEQGVRA